MIKNLKQIKFSHIYILYNKKVSFVPLSTDEFSIIYRVAQKSKPLTIFQKIVLKIANEIRFRRKVKVCIKHYNTIRW